MNILGTQGKCPLFGVMVFMFSLKIKNPEYWHFWRALKSFCFYRKQVRLFPKTPWITGTLPDIRLRRLCSHGNKKRHQVASHLMGWELQVGEISLHLTFRGNMGWLQADQLCGQAEEMLMAVFVIILAILIFWINWKPRIKVTFWGELSLNDIFLRSSQRWFQTFLVLACT